MNCLECRRTIARRNPPPARYPPISCASCGEGFHLSCTDLQRSRNFLPSWTCRHCTGGPAAAPVAPAPAAPPPVTPSTPAAQRATNLPPGASAPHYSFLQWNADGIQSSKTELESYLHRHKVKVAAIQETKLNPRSPTPSFRGYNLVREDRRRNSGGGLAFLIHDSVHFTNLNIDTNDQYIEAQGITITFHSSKLNILNIYIPPASSCPGHTLDEDVLSTLLSSDADTLVLGDLNAHNVAWFSSTSCDRAAVRGEVVAAAIDNSSLVLLNGPAPTHPLPVPSSPDISLISAHLATAVEWQVHHALNSDHLPISISFVNDTPPIRSRCTFTNFKRADWPSFTSITENKFNSLPPPTSTYSATNTFNKILLDAAKTTIPSGYRKNFDPTITPEILELTAERDALRASSPEDPALRDLNAAIGDRIRNTARSRWRTQVSSISHRSNTSRFWNLIRSLSGKRTRVPPNQPISFTNRSGTSKAYSKPSAIAKQFTRLFTSINVHSRDPNLRRTLRRVKTLNLDPTFTPFSDGDTAAAIRRCNNSTATGPDGLTVLHLKHLGPSGIAYLTKIFNLSISKAELPDIWKKALIIAILKAGKTADQGRNYRPISLLCPASKILERLVLPYLTESLAPNRTQHGFRPLHSTTTALLPLSTMIATGFNQRKPASRTATLAIDFSKAFDSVHHPTLLLKLLNSSLHPNIVRWLFTYLRGRKAACLHNSITAPFRIIHSGVPQGSVISPCLFNFFVSDCPVTPPLITSYADDVTIAVSHPDISRDASTISSLLSDSFVPVSNWAEGNKMGIAPDKSSATLFTPWTSQVNAELAVTINGARVPTEKKPKILGVTFDPLFTFTPHVADIAARASRRLQVLKALTGTTWGQDKETILLTYKAIIKPIISYAAPIWFPTTSRTNIAKLQRIQNQALRTASGSIMMSDIQHLHSETEILPLAEHLSMLCSQFLVSALRPSHPSFDLVTLDPGPRPRKPLLQTIFGPSVAEVLEEDGTTDPANYRPAIRAVHTAAVDRHLASRDHNKVLLRPAPSVSASELLLPRHYRTTLSQLRSGYCSRLLTYKQTIGSSDSDLCPECGTEPHTAAHIFRCPGAPTALAVEDLWHRPVEVANHIASLSAFADLPPLELREPRPPPEPPPGV